jgi:hypothetical protein
MTGFEPVTSRSQNEVTELFTSDSYELGMFESDRSRDTQTRKLLRELPDAYRVHQLEMEGTENCTSNI